MALLLVTGVAGTGKTLYGIQKYIIPEIKSGGIVYTNIDGLIPARIAILYNMEIFDVEKNLRPIDDLQHFYKNIEKNSMVVLDEAQNIFNNRDWQNPANSECNSYLMEHRHYGHKLVFITPHIESLDAGIRRVAEFTYMHKSFSALGNKTTVRCAVFSQANITKEPLQFFTWHHDTRVYDCYKSYFEEGTVEKKPRINPLRNATLLFLFLFVLITGGIAIRNGSYFVNKMNRKKANVEIEKKVPSESNLRKRRVIMINDSVIGG